MRCDSVREAASARLDGEAPGISEAEIDRHLRGCSGCAAWVSDATALTRRLRLGSATDVPDLTDTLAQDVVGPARRVRRRRTALRWALAAAGVAQLALAVPALGGDSLGMPMAVHAAHEGAAWNLALAVAFAATAASPRRAAGLIPLLSTFVAVLTVLSVHDVMAGEVGLGRLATHLAALVGLVLVVLTDRAERARPPRRRSPRHTGSAAEARSGLRGVA